MAQPLSLNGPYTEHPSKSDSVDAGPFLDWLEGWCRGQDRGRVGSGWTNNTAGTTSSETRKMATLADLAELAGISPRAFSRGRLSGRLSRQLIDRVLIAAGGDVMLAHLYPEDD